MRKYITIFFSIVLITLPFISHAQFSDIQKDSLTYLYRHGIIDGYPDGTFGPTKNINRAELAKLILEAHHVQLLPEKNCFPDVVSGSWYESYVCTAKKLGYLQGYPDGTFKPEQFINKAEALKIIAEIQKWELMVDPLTKGFYDIPKDAWYYDYVKAARYYGYIDQMNNFYPTNFITRGEVAEILFRVNLKQKMGADLGNDVALLARDFFRIEEEVLTFYDYTYFEIEKNGQVELLTGYDYQKDEPIVEQLQTMIMAQDGYTYAIMELSVDGPMPDRWLEYEAKNNIRTNILLIAKFDSSKKRLAFDWYNFFSSPTTGYFFKLTEANENKVAVQFWGSQASGINSLAYAKEFILEDVR